MDRVLRGEKLGPPPRLSDLDAPPSASAPVTQADEGGIEGFGEPSPRPA